MNHVTAPPSAPRQPAQHSLAACLARLERDPTDRAAWQASAVAFVAMGAYADAVAAQKQVVALEDGDAAAWHELGRLQILEGRRADAVDSLNAALARRPGLHEARVRLGMLHLHRAELDEAGMCFGTVLQADPERMDARAGAAQLLDRKGDVASAWELVSTTRGRPSTALAIAAATVGLHSGNREKALRIVRKAQERAQGHDRSMLHHAEGDLLDALGRHGAAWRAWSAGNAERRLSFDRAAHDKVVGALIALTKTLPTPTGPADDRPVFVVGMPRSGTTLLETMLDAHGQIHGVGELSTIPELAGAIPRLLGGGSTYLQHLDRLPEIAPDLGRAYLTELDGLAPGAVRAVDKMPHNALHLAVVATCLPGARVIWMDRDPDDVAVSCFQKTLSAGLPWATSLAGIRCWQRNLDRLRTHWEAVLPNPMLTVRYEDLVADPEAQSRRVCAFLDVPFDEEMLRFHEARRQVATASFDQVTEPIHTRRVGRGAAYRPFMVD
jgi:tetratricopeptide (TPR) repeat protein